MKQVCLHCNRTTSDNNLWCQEKTCPAEKSPDILTYGEQIGDMEIVKLLVTLRTSSLYEARRLVKGKEQRILLKIAHDGFHERLKRETEILRALSTPKGLGNPLLPVLLPAHSNATLHDYAYGKTVFRGQGRYYCIYQHVKGDSLSSLLLKNPQPWYQHVAWLTMSLVEVIAMLHTKGIYHLCLSPESVLVRYDRNNIPRPVLIDLGLATGEQDVRLHWDLHYALPVYTAPELVDTLRSISYAQTDVYGLGMLLYEMLAGRTAYKSQFRTEADIYSDILDSNTPPVPIYRPDLTKDISDIAHRAIRKESRARYQNVIALGQALQEFFPGGVPLERKDRRVNWQSVTIVACVLLAIALLIIMAVSLTQTAT